MKRASLILTYSAFATLSIAVNIAAQAICMHLYNGTLSIPLSILIGTGAGLVCKYVLDKRYIFRHSSATKLGEARTFGLYTLMGMTTTLVFWGTETAFHFIFAPDFMRYVGGVIGLSIGYTAKYQLDKKYVFVKPLSTVKE